MWCGTHRFGSSIIVLDLIIVELACIVFVEVYIGKSFRRLLAAALQQKFFSLGPHGTSRQTFINLAGWARPCLALFGSVALSCWALFGSVRPCSALFGSVWPFGSALFGLDRFSALFGSGQ